MNANLQQVARRYFETRSEKDFNLYYELFRPIAKAASKKYLKDIDMIEENITTVFMKAYSNPRFVFDNDKPHQGYIGTLACRFALTMLAKKKRDILVTETSLTSKFDSDEIPDSMLDIISQKKGHNSTFDSDCIKNVANSSSKKLEKVTQLIGEMKDDVIKEAIYGEKAYEMLLSEHKLNSLGCIKTRVFRARTSIKRKLDLEANYNLLLDNEITSGDFCVCYKSGSISLMGTIQDGVLHGPIKIMYEDGTLKTQGAYLNGEKEGEWLNYDKNGKLSSKGNYKNGFEYGIWEHYDGLISKKTKNLVSIIEYCGDAVFFKNYENFVLVATGIYGRFDFNR